MAKTTIGGKVTDTRTAKMLRAAEKIVGIKFQLAQGSFNGNNVFASGGTHAGSGVVDIRTVPMKNRKQKMDAVAALRKVGFAAWFRPLTYNQDGSLLWGEHIHAVAIGSKNLSSSAAKQVVAYRNGYDGLAGMGGKRPDPHADLGVDPTTWAAYKRSIKPKAGITRVTTRTYSVRDPYRDARRVQRRKVGNRVVYVGTKRVAGETWLRLASGNWMLAKHTARGD